MDRIIRSLALSFTILVPLAAQARNTEVLLPADEAATSERGTSYLLGVPFYLKGQPGAPTGKPLSNITSRQATRGAFRSDAASCRVAFLTALRKLQEHASQSGGDAVVDIVSVTGDERTESPTHYRCVAGAVVVHVALEGKVVDLD